MNYHSYVFKLAVANLSITDCYATVMIYKATKNDTFVALYNAIKVSLRRHTPEAYIPRDDDVCHI